jgi:hypothetical protein
VIAYALATMALVNGYTSDLYGPCGPCDVWFRFGPEPCGCYAPYEPKPGESNAHIAWEQISLAIIDGIEPRAPWAKVPHTFEEYVAWQKLEPQ